MADTDKLIIQKGRTNVVPLDIGYDVSGETITSEIRTESDVLICTWTVTFDSDGSDGKCVLTLDDLITGAITHSSGLMDVKRVSTGEPFAVFEMPIEVEFRETVTA